MIRKFTATSATDSKVVAIALELSGTRMTVVQKMADGTKKRSEKELTSEAEARSATEQLARQLVSRGYIERVDRGPNPAANGARAPKPAARARERETASANPAFDDLEAHAALHSDAPAANRHTAISRRRAQEKKEKERQEEKAEWTKR